MINKARFTLKPKFIIKPLYCVIYSVILEDKLSNILFKSSMTDSKPANPLVKEFPSGKLNKWHNPVTGVIISRNIYRKLFS